MKNKLVIFFSISLILISCFCLAMFFKNKDTQTITICNSISEEQTTIQANTGAKYSQYLKTQELYGYEFEGYYYDKEFTQKVDLSEPISSSKTIYEAYIQNLTSEQEINTKAIGVNYIGEIYVQKLALLLQFKKVSIQTEQSIDFDGLDSIVEELTIANSTKISNIKNFPKLKSLNIKNVGTIENCCNNINSIKEAKNIDCQTIKNSFCDCKNLKVLSLAIRVENIDASFYKTPLETIESNSPVYVVINNVLHKKDNEDYIVVKATTNIEEFSSDTRTSEILNYAFYNCKKLEFVEVCGRVSKIGESAFEQSAIKSVDFSRNYTILTIGENAFSQTEKLENVNFGSFVYRINEKAFWNSGLKKADLLACEFLTYIGKYAFANCTKLTEAKFSGSDNIITAKEGVFSECQNLTKVENINFAQLDDMLFFDCENLTTLTGQNITGKIGNLAFYNCKNISAASVLAQATSIGKSAFENCFSIVNIHFSNLANVQEKAFCNATNLTLVTLGNQIENIDFSAFDGCTNISQINFSSTNYTKQNDAIYSANMQSLLYYMPNSAQTSFNIIASLNHIEAKYLSQAKNLAEITSSNSNYVCQNGVLYSVAGGKKLICYPAGKTTEEFIVPSDVTTICAQSFVGCPNLTSLQILENVQIIENNSLAKMYALEYLKISFVGQTISNTQTGFLGWIFGAKSYAENHKYIPNTLTGLRVSNQTQYAEGTFYECENLLSITIDNINNITNYMFTGCLNLQQLIINDTIQTMGLFAFYGCKNLVEIRIGYYANISIHSTGLTNMSSNVTIYVYGMTDIASQLIGYKEKFAKSTWTWRTL